MCNPSWRRLIDATLIRLKALANKQLSTGVGSPERSECSDHGVGVTLIPSWCDLRPRSWQSFFFGWRWPYCVTAWVQNPNCWTARILPMICQCCNTFGCIGYIFVICCYSYQQTSIDCKQSQSAARGLTTWLWWTLFFLQRDTWMDLNCQKNTTSVNNPRIPRFVRVNLQ